MTAVHSWDPAAHAGLEGARAFDQISAHNLTMNRS
jgi:hypothetical protein